MTDKLTLNIVGANNTVKKVTVNVPDKQKYISIMPDIETRKISQAQYDMFVRGANTINKLLHGPSQSPEEKMQQFYKNGFDELYDIKLSNDGKFYEITVKPTKALYPDPRIRHIKQDFGLKSGVFLEYNRNLVGDNPDDPEVDNFDYNKIKGGTTFRIPVAETHFNSSPNGFWGRNFGVY